MNIHRLFSDASDVYARSRPKHPKDIYNYLAAVTAHKDLAWDCGCGNGQVSVDLIKIFERVEATDISAEQIAEAPELEGVNFAVSPAESTPFAEQSFDLICVGQALHWFDYEKFWPEVDRVLKPGGVFAAWGYVFPYMNAEIDAVLKETLYDVIQPYWSERNRLLWNHYRDVDIPYPRLDSPDFQFTIEWNLQELLSYISTWSAVKNCIKAQGDNFFKEACRRVSDLWMNHTEMRTIKMDFCFIATQKPDSICV